jgi:hypothetical protein
MGAYSNATDNRAIQIRPEDFRDRQGKDQSTMPSTSDDETIIALRGACDRHAGHAGPSISRELVRDIAECLPPNVFEVTVMPEGQCAMIRTSIATSNSPQVIGAVSLLSDERNSVAVASKLGTLANVAI